MWASCLQLLATHEPSICQGAVIGSPPTLKGQQMAEEFIPLGELSQE